MYYRRKIILALIELVGGEVEKLRFQKLLFLYAMRKPHPEYDFIPYKYSGYSFSAKADMNTMVKKDLLKETENQYIKNDNVSYLDILKSKDKNLLKDVIYDYGHMSSRALIKHTYLNFPFYAIRSTIVNEILSKEQYDRIEKEIPKDTNRTLFTLGYEGISLEKYLQKLIKNNVKLLVDVRKNALSMKFGFSKSLLKRYCNSLDIEYIHIPEVGIVSEKRKQLESQEDYDNLFIEYGKTTLQDTIEVQKQIFDLIKKYRRIALTCFEAEPCRCHRSPLASSIQQLPHFEYPLIHL